eukprot:g1981.t1
MQSQLNLFKACSGVGILLITILSAWFPLKFSKGKGDNAPLWDVSIIAHFNYLASGVFLGAGLLHMLPDAVHLFEDLHITHFPLTNLTAIFGYCLIWIIESMELGGSTARAVAVATKAVTSNHRSASICSVRVEPRVLYENEHKDATASYGTLEIQNEETDWNGEDSCHSPPPPHHHHMGGHSSSPSQSIRSKPVVPGVTVHEATNPRDENFVHHQHITFENRGGVLPFILALLFSVHSFIAGLALGVQSKVGNAAVAVLIAILAHKTVEAMTVSSSFVKEGITSKSFGPVLIYCIMTPLGILVGTLLTKSISGIGGILLQSQASALAAGSFIYICSHEISDVSCKRHVSRTNQVVFVFLGVVIMAILAIWV